MQLSFKNKRRLYNIKQYFKHGPVINSREQKVIDIVTTKIRKKNVELIFTPISGNRYIISDDKSLTIILTGETAIISNHEYHFDISLGADTVEILNDKFDRILESRTRIADREIMSNMDNTLAKIARKVKEQQ